MRIDEKTIAAGAAILGVPVIPEEKRAAGEFLPDPPAYTGLDWDQFILLVGRTRFYSRIFVVNGEERNCLAALFKNEGETDWCFAIRFRYYAPDDGRRDPFHDDDRRSGQAYRVPPGKKVEMLKFVRWMLGQALGQGFGGDGAIHEIVLETNDDRAILRALKREPFFHMAAGKGGR